MYDNPHATRADYLRLLAQHRRTRAIFRACLVQDADVPEDWRAAMQLAADHATDNVVDHLQQTRLRFGNSQAYLRRWEVMFNG